MTGKPKVWITKRKYPSGKHCYAVRWVNPVTGKCHNKAFDTDKKPAQTFAGQRRRELRAGIIDDLRPVSWAEFADEHVKSRAGKRNRQSIKITLERFGELCRPRGPHLVTYGMIEGYVQRRRELVTVTTINRELRELRCAFGEAVRRRQVPSNPMGTPRDGIRFEPCDEPIPVVLTDDEKRALLTACPDLLWRTFLFVLMTTGCRRGEIQALTWDRIDLDEGYVRLTRTKGKRDRLQPLVADAVAMLRELAAGMPMIVSDGRAHPKEPCVFREIRWNTNRTFQSIRATAKVPHAQMKALRSTAATDAANSGFDVSQAGDFLGHADYKVTRRHYVMRDLESKRQVAESLAARLRSA